VLTGFPEIEGTRLACCGASQGGGLSLACAALENRVKRTAPIFPFLSDYKRVWEMDLAKDAYFEIKEYFRRYDPRHEREDEIFSKLGYIDIQFLAPRIKAEVLLQTGLLDTTCPPSSQFAAYNKISSKKNVLIYPDFGHEGAPGHWDTILSFIAGNNTF
jgi:cephalosporin-C deacetylase